ncbi:MAG: putative Ser protein kinase [Candidatus Saccharibacteria bacterium]|nr:putative Ser protein kinase [Candidatus Saccharibacteria bacterium]
MPGERPGRHDIFGEVDKYNKEHEKRDWEGSFDDYIEKAIDQPSILRTAQRTAYDAVTSRPDFFTTGRNALFGAEKATTRFIDTLKAGSEGLELGRRLIILVGPPGSGKSTLVNGTKRGIEDYTQTDEGAMYAIKDCPMHEEPLHLLPKYVRASLEDKFGHIEGDLCPDCESKYGGDKLKNGGLQDVKVERVFISEKDRVGIGTFKPSDPKSQDITELIGSPDYSMIGEVGSASDARAYKFDGELNKANRGLMEFVEMLKSDEKFLYTLLDLVQDRVIKAPRFPVISADEVILAHTNMSEYNAYVQNPKNEALRDRMVVIPVPYTLETSAEQKIHEKLIGQSDIVRRKKVHINPRTLETAATFAVLSRIKPGKKYDKEQKLRIYDGQQTADLTQRDLREIQDEFPDEGMSGISPRYVIDSLSSALIEGEDKKCLTPIDAIRALRNNLEYHAHTRDMKKEDKDALKDDLNTVKTMFDKVAIKEVQSAFVGEYQDNARRLCDNYLNNIEAFCNKTKIVDQISDEELNPDEKLMRSIEEQIGVSESSKKEWRTELLMRMGSIYRNGGTFTHESHPRLKEAIEKKMFTEMKDMIKLTTSAKRPDDDQKKRLNTVQTRLEEEQGYCAHCSDQMIRYVGNLLSRAES